MVRYPITDSKLLDEIEKLIPGWLEKAAKRTLNFTGTNGYNEEKGNWSPIKEVYMHIQGSKCAFCERQLESEVFGKIEHDVEHYRPKKSATAWPTEKIRRERNITLNFHNAPDLPTGYPLLSYQPWNYITSCKTCNSTLKNNFFPITGSRISGKPHPKDYRAEEPYLIYPLGTLDSDPEDIFHFEGIIPVPRHQSGKKRLRALVTIAFFELATRDTLLEQRARRLADFARAFEDSISGSSAKKRERAQLDVDTMTSIKAPHANCVRSYHKVCSTDINAANNILDSVYDYLEQFARQ
jgi:hypothetical protein